MTDIPQARTRRFVSAPILDAGGMATLVILVLAFLVPALVWIELAPAPTFPTRRPIELVMLERAAIFALLLPMAQIGAQIRRYGGSAVRGNRDFHPHLAGVVGRLARAHANSVESLAAFAAVVLAANAMGVSNRWTIAAATLYLIARIVHALAYAASVAIIRSSAYYAGWLATMTIAIATMVN